MAIRLNIIPKGQAFSAFIEQETERCMAFLTRHMGLSEELAHDVFQESCIALYNNITNGKLSNLTSSLSTYLISICKNQAKTRIKKEKKEAEIKVQIKNETGKIRINSSDLEDEDSYTYSLDKAEEILTISEEEDGYSFDELEEKVGDIVNNLPEPCNKILWGRYRDNLSHKVLADIYNYKSADVVKTQASRCLKRFETIIKSLLRNQENEN